VGVFVINAAVIVEFTGMPGAGKTTIASAVISALTAKGYVCFPPGLGTIGSPQTKRLGQLPQN